MWKQSLAALAAAISLGASARVDINQATAADLDGIKGIGPASAARLSGEGVTVQGTPYPASPGKPGRTP